MRYGAIWPVYAHYWDAMVINPGRIAEFTVEAQFALENKANYQTIANAVPTVPWYQIAVLHRREASGNFACYLGNGQPLNERTTITPRNRGPFPTFLMGAVDALRYEAWDKIIDWRLEKMLYQDMLFNGPGYELRGLPSPYVWGGTNIQRSGKFVADDKFDPNEIDPQPGCAPLLAMIARLDGTITFTRESA